MKRLDIGLSCKYCYDHLIFAGWPTWSSILKSHMENRNLANRDMVVMVHNEITKWFYFVYIYLLYHFFFFLWLGKGRGILSNKWKFLYGTGRKLVQCLSVGFKSFWLVIHIMFNACDLSPASSSWFKAGTILYSLLAIWYYVHVTIQIKKFDMIIFSQIFHMDNI